jgi:tRNA uridine 5-carbamoylmethylation protein Kti12
MNYSNNATSSKKYKPKSQKRKSNKWQVILHAHRDQLVDHIIESLMDICGFGEHQSLQCVIVAQQTNHCVIYTDTHDICLSIQQQFHHEKINVTIHPYEKNH